MSTDTRNPPPTAAKLHARFDAADPDTLERTLRAQEVLSRVGEDPRFKLELPAAQLEIVVEPAATVPEAAGALLDARRDLAARVGIPSVPGWLASKFSAPCAGVHSSSQ